jgi:hypothetical protein
MGGIRGVISVATGRARSVGAIAWVGATPILTRASPEAAIFGSESAKGIVSRRRGSAYVVFLRFLGSRFVSSLAISRSFASVVHCLANSRNFFLSFESLASAANSVQRRALMRHCLGSPGMGLIVQSGRIPVE